MTASAKERYRAGIKGTQERDQRMKCPLFAMGFIMSDRSTPETALDCLQTECAWWVPSLEQCSIYVLAVPIAQTELRRQREAYHD